LGGEIAVTDRGFLCDKKLLTMKKTGARRVNSPAWSFVHAYAKTRRTGNGAPGKYRGQHVNAFIHPYE